MVGSLACSPGDHQSRLAQEHPGPVRVLEHSSAVLWDLDLNLVCVLDDGATCLSCRWLSSRNSEELFGGPPLTSRRSLTLAGRSDRRQ